MAEMFKLQIVTPERVFYEGDASMVELSTTEGDIRRVCQPYSHDSYRVAWHS